MKKFLVSVILILSLSSFKSLYNYLITPVNCLSALGGSVIRASLDFGKCVYQNVTFQKGEVL